MKSTEAPEHARPAIGESIPPAATPLLRTLGVLDRVTAAGHLECPGSRSLWGSSEVGHNDFFVDPVGRGYHLDRRLFDRQLREAARDRGVEVRAGTRLTDVRDGTGGLELRSASSRDDGLLAPELVVDATGPRRAVTRRLGIADNVVDRLVCVCAFVDAPFGTPATDHTLLESCEHGWWYAARLPEGRAIVMLATDVETVRARSLTELDPWRAALSRTELIGPEVAEAVLSGRALELVSRTAPIRILSGVIGERWVAVGDAARAYDPIGAAGITDALAHGIAAGEGIVRRLRGGGQGALGRYQDRVFADFTDHVRLRATLYAAEPRWPDAPFWRGRPSATLRPAMA